MPVSYELTHAGRTSWASILELPVERRLSQRLGREEGRTPLGWKRRRTRGEKEASPSPATPTLQKKTYWGRRGVLKTLLETFVGKGRRRRGQRTQEETYIWTGTSPGQMGTPAFLVPVLQEDGLCFPGAESGLLTYSGVLFLILCTSPCLKRYYICLGLLFWAGCLKREKEKK